MEKKKIIGIGSICLILIILSSVFMFTNVIQPKRYDKYISSGNQDLLSENYQEAILAFEKAIKIDKESIEARVGAAKGYVGVNDIKTAVIKLREAQELDMSNENLIIEILNILKTVDVESSYEMLQIYINKVGKDNLSYQINSIFNEANSKPRKPNIYPLAGKYANTISAEFDLDNIKYGHRYYYTTDGSIPNKNSSPYMGKIEISKSTTIKMIGYNLKDECTDVHEIRYEIDQSEKIALESYIEEAKSLLKNATEGKKVGNYKPGSKEPLENLIKEIEKKLKKTVLTISDIREMDAQLMLAVSTFKDNIVEDKTLEDELMSKLWVDDSEWVLKINKTEIFYANFHEGLNYEIIDRSISNNRIDYTVNYYGEIQRISIYKNSDNSISVSSSSAEYSSISNTYTAISKNEVIGIAHDHQDYGADYDFVEDPNFCINFYENLAFDRFGISLEDVRNYYKYN